METPTPFDLDLTVRSHGFYDLAPWRYDPDRRVLGRPLRLAKGRVVDAEVAPGHGVGAGLAVRLTAKGRLSAGESAEARRQLRACLGLDEDLAPFYARIHELDAGGGQAPALQGSGRQAPALQSGGGQAPALQSGGRQAPALQSGGGQAPDPQSGGGHAVAQRRPRQMLPPLAWAAARGAGRLLRSPTVFEDAVKTLCTTNCSWALTRIMTTQLVERLGEPGPGGARTFPTPQAMAAQPERFYRDTIRAGYRAGSLRELARRVASGELDVEAWRTSPLGTDALAEQIVELSGFGPYATEHLLRLLGRHDHLALDSWTRGKLARLRGRRRIPTDRAIRAWYAPYGRFAGLAMWLEVTADWHGSPPTWP